MADCALVYNITGSLPYIQMIGYGKNWFPVSDTNDCSHVTNNNAIKRSDVTHCDVTDVTSLLQIPPWGPGIEFGPPHTLRVS
jgi:hypothetical protein